MLFDFGVTEGHYNAQIGATTINVSADHNCAYAALVVALKVSCLPGTVPYMNGYIDGQVHAFIHRYIDGYIDR